MPAPHLERIGIIGAGMIGKPLAKHFVAVGHQVFVANARGPETLATFAVETGAMAVSSREAARLGDVVIVTIPMRRVETLPIELFENASDTKIVIDTGNYYPCRDGQIPEIDAGLLESEWVARTLRRPVIKAFNNISFVSLGERGLPAGSPGRIALSVAGDDASAKEVVMTLVGSIGFDPLDAGTIAESWRQQPGTPAYCKDLDLAAMRAALAAAEWQKIPEYRATANDFAKRYLAGEVSL